jgi:hypothetical protein
VRQNYWKTEKEERKKKKKTNYTKKNFKEKKCEMISDKAYILIGARRDRGALVQLQVVECLCVGLGLVPQNVQLILVVVPKVLRLGLGVSAE